MWPLIKNNIRVLMARKSTLVILLILPVILFSVALVSNFSSAARMNIGFADQDQSRLSEALAGFMAKDGSRVRPVSEEEAEGALLEGREEAVVIVPEGFEKAFMAGEMPRIAIRTLKGQEITGNLKRAVDMYLSSLSALREIRQAQSPEELADAMKEADGQGIRFRPERINPEGINRSLSMAGGFLFYIMAMSMLQATSLILDEKHWNTLNRIRQAPVERSVYILASVVSAVVFLCANLAALWAVSALVFRVGTTPAMYLLWFYYGLIWIFFGVFLSLVVKSRAVYSSLVPIVTTIFAMLGGSFWPLWLMPPFMQKLAMITPHYWANDAMALIQRHQSLLAQRTDLLALTGFLVLFFALGVFVLRRGQSAQSFL